MKSKRPAGGKAKPGMAFAAAKHRRDIEFTNCVNEPVADCGVQQRPWAHGGRPPWVSPRGGDPKNRMMEICRSGSVGGAGGNSGSYPEADRDYVLGLSRHWLEPVPRQNRGRASAAHSCVLVRQAKLGASCGVGVPAE